MKKILLTMSFAALALLGGIAIYSRTTKDGAEEWKVRCSTLRWRMVGVKNAADLYCKKHDIPDSLNGEFRKLVERELALLSKEKHITFPTSLNWLIFSSARDKQETIRLAEEKLESGQTLFCIVRSSDTPGAYFILSKDQKFGLLPGIDGKPLILNSDRVNRTN